MFQYECILELDNHTIVQFTASCDIELSQSTVIEYPQHNSYYKFEENPVSKDICKYKVNELKKYNPNINGNFRQDKGTQRNQSEML